ncbi:MAG: hypothetical protein HRU23_12520 [Gammaproteobacteria bacterium]|nr:hypothetical protein [Gammaproteobacteria bacterium]
MGFLSKLFGKSGQNKSVERQLDHPNKLLVGDIICLDDSFALPSQLKGQSLEVTEVNCYEYEHHKNSEWVLRGNNDQLIFMSYEKDDDERLVFSIKITRDQVEQLFDLDQFSQLFDEPGQAKLELKQTLPEFNNWLGQLYRQTDFATVGFYHQKDHRSEEISQYEGSDQGDSFELYSAVSDDERYAIEAEVYQGGETDVILCLYRPISDIRQYWPKSQ